MVEDRRRTAYGRSYTGRGVACASAERRASRHTWTLRVGVLKYPSMELPASLRRWFVAHFVVDLAFALPLLFAPEAFLRALGWTVIDPVAARLVGAALLAIGGQSFIGRDQGVEAYRAMLNLKLIWSASAVVSLVVGVGNGAPPAAWALLATFIAFFGVWTHYRVRLEQMAAAQTLPDHMDDPDDQAAVERTL